ncbi:Gfo/Idh/MocA family protein [Bacillus sp. FJAT-27445]|uniref:Gfo/Idh/MocA family protein n=1 Tax=Bacillus sp. FJAT-27445 TaxID=1679166 RepID=UPI000743C002|nr:Gfo/Idh/MocA family oxidoreductase [Bacillus sp. FJAT-27445]
MGKINVGIIGTGGIGERVLNAFQAHPDTEVLGAFDGNADRLAEISEKYGIAAAEDYKELFDNPDINLIYIAVPPKFHHQFVTEALRSNKNVLCEKPLASTVAEADEMLAAATSRGLIHAVNFPTVFGGGFLELERLAGDGFLGDLRRVELHCHFEEWPRKWQQNSWISSREQGGFVREVFPHYIQIILHLFGKISDIHSSLELPDNPELCETGIIANGRLSNGVPVLFNGLSGIGMKEELRFDLFGTEGTLSLRNWSELWAGRKNEPLQRVETDVSNSYQVFIEELVNAFEGKPSRIVSFQRGRDVQEVLDQLLGAED